ncbi:MAG TPA: hypothetical protein PKC18_13595, partial [Lacipirellulaceae bacterium]|nr:hypothetical protein [Lacipirellulaceae bacterium]
ASQQPLPLPQQPSWQQGSLQPQEASQQHLLLRPPSRRLRKQPRRHLLLQQLEAQPHAGSQQPLPQQSSGQPHEASQQPLPLPQQPSWQQGSSHPHEASQQHEDFLQRLNRPSNRQPRFFLQHDVPQQQSSGQPHEASQQPSWQQGSSQQPHDFSQQHDGSQASQPQPLPSIRSSKPAP